METEQRLYLLESKRDCLQLRNPGKVDEVAANLKDRYAKNQAVTAVGSSIALAINTKSGSSSLSSSSLSRRNSGSSSSAAANNIQEESGSSSSSSSSGTSPLSLMDIVHSAYSRMLNKQQDQSIILR